MSPFAFKEIQNVKTLKKEDNTEASPDFLDNREPEKVMIPVQNKAVHQSLPEEDDDNVLSTVNFQYQID